VDFSFPELPAHPVNARQPVSFPNIFRMKISLRFESPPQKRGTIATFSCSGICATQPEWMVHAQTTLGNGAHDATRLSFSSNRAAFGSSVDARCCGQCRSDRSKGRTRSRPWLGPWTRLSTVWLEPRAQGRLARPWLPTRSLEEGLVLKSNRLPSRTSSTVPPTTPVPRCP
jgi:hypothetical protein